MKLFNKSVHTGLLFLNFVSLLCINCQVEQKVEILNISMFFHPLLLVQPSHCKTQHLIFSKHLYDYTFIMIIGSFQKEFECFLAYKTFSNKLLPVFGSVSKSRYSRMDLFVGIPCFCQLWFVFAQFYNSIGDKLAVFFIGR